MNLLENSRLVKLIERSKTSQRRRAAIPLHNPAYLGPQVLFNAMQPDSYMQPHKHSKHEEMWFYVEGEICLVSFDERGGIWDMFFFKQDYKRFVEMPRDTFHTALAIKPDSVFLNISQGPYDERTSKTFANWAPTEQESWLPYFKDLKSRVL